MKKFIFALFVMFSLVTLSACWNKTDKTSNTWDNQNITNEKTTTDNQEQNDKTSLTEYQFGLVMETTTSWKVQKMSTKVYKKWWNSLYEIIEMPGVFWDKMKPLKTLVVDWTSYSQMEIKWKKYRFKLGNANLWMNDVFDIEKMQEQVKWESTSNKKESIDWKKMTCYYKEWENWKACFYKWLFTYWEFDNAWTKSVMRIVDFKTKVKDSVFKVPTDVKTQQDMAKLLMWTSSDNK